MKRIFVLLVLFVLLFRVSLDTQAQSQSIHIASPQAYQVFQRVNGAANILITGYAYGTNRAQVEASWDGENWFGLNTVSTQKQPIYRLMPIQNRGGVWQTSYSFSGSLNVPQGQYTIRVRIIGTDTVQTIPYVGVGDVFVLAGQSNASGRGYHNQVVTHPTLKASMFGNDYRWHELKDPVDSPINSVDSISLDKTASGSYWPILASYIMADQNVPVAFIPVAKGGTTVSQWQPIIRFNSYYQPLTLYTAMYQRLRQLRTPIKAVLWHQGEQDAYAHATIPAYVSRLTTLANAVMNDFRAPLIAAELQAIRTNPPIYTLRINQAIEQVITAHPYVLQGPDFRDMQTDDTAHFQSDAKLQEAARRWWLALKAAVYQ